jgi:hypothetical protein
MVRELDSMTVEEIGRHVVISPDGGVREITPEEAKTLHDMVHKTEKANKTFTMNDVEYASAQIFAEKHKNCTSKSAMSEKFEYSFIPGGIGTCVSIKCLICKEEENITDIDCW